MTTTATDLRSAAGRSSGAVTAISTEDAVLDETTVTRGQGDGTAGEPERPRTAVNELS